MRDFHIYVFFILSFFSFKYFPNSSDGGDFNQFSFLLSFIVIVHVDSNNLL